MWNEEEIIAYLKNDIEKLPLASVGNVEDFRRIVASRAGKRASPLNSQGNPRNYVWRRMADQK